MDDYKHIKCESHDNLHWIDEYTNDDLIARITKRVASLAFTKLCTEIDFNKPYIVFQKMQHKRDESKCEFVTTFHLNFKAIYLITCPYCGKTVIKADYCHECGARLSGFDLRFIKRK